MELRVRFSEGLVPFAKVFRETNQCRTGLLCFLCKTSMLGCAVLLILCECDPIFVSNLYADFCENLRQQKTLEKWAEWLDAVVDQVSRFAGISLYLNLFMFTGVE